ncbi:MAG: hypothetical protein ACK55Z_10810, partial [bacterium]
MRTRFRSWSILSLQHEGQVLVPRIGDSPFTFRTLVLNGGQQRRPSLGDGFLVGEVQQVGEGVYLRASGTGEPRHAWRGLVDDASAVAHGHLEPFDRTVVALFDPRHCYRNGLANLGVDDPEMLRRPR